MDEMKYLYRCEQYLESRGGIGVSGDWEPSPGGPAVVLRMDKYEIIKETPKGYWINISYSLKGRTKPIEKWEKRWVSSTTFKRYAYPTEAEAYRGFIARKQRQIRILEANIRHSKSALQLAKLHLPREERFKDLFNQIKYLDELPALWTWSFTEEEVAQIDKWYAQVKTYNSRKRERLDEYMRNEYERAVLRSNIKRNEQQAVRDNN